MNKKLNIVRLENDMKISCQRNNGTDTVDDRISNGAASEYISIKIRLGTILSYRIVSIAIITFILNTEANFTTIWIATYCL